MHFGCFEWEQGGFGGWEAEWDVVMEAVRVFIIDGDVFSISKVHGLKVEKDFSCIQKSLGPYMTIG